LHLQILYLDLWWCSVFLTRNVILFFRIFYFIEMVWNLQGFVWHLLCENKNHGHDWNRLNRPEKIATLVFLAVKEWETNFIWWKLSVLSPKYHLRHHHAQIWNNLFRFMALISCCFRVNVFLKIYFSHKNLDMLKLCFRVGLLKIYHSLNSKRNYQVHKK